VDNPGSPDAANFDVFAWYGYRSNVVARGDHVPRGAGGRRYIRTFTMEEWAGHAQLASAVVQAGQQQLLGEAANGSIRETLNSVIPPRLKQ
jgi:hypothetical protein